MSALLLERAPALDEGVERDASPRLDDALFAGTVDAHGRLTLDDLITGAWEGLAVHGAVTCPVCTSSMAARSPEQDAGTPAGTCLTCGSQLS
jgi:hypothetical protein